MIIQGGGGRQTMQPCSVELKEDRVVIKQPLLASNRSPKMPRTLAIKGLKNIERIEPEELFEQIYQCNTQTLVQLIRELEDVDAQHLRTSCLDQLAAISHHYVQQDDLLNESSAESPNN